MTGAESAHEILKMFNSITLPVGNTLLHILFDCVYASEAKIQEMTIDYTQEMGTLLPTLDPITAWRLQIEWIFPPRL